jgi:hypothetical protein
VQIAVVEQSAEHAEYAEHSELLERPPLFAVVRFAGFAQPIEESIEESG